MTDELIELAEPTATTELTPPTRHFTILLSATRRGARLARRLTVQQLIDWYCPFETAEQIVAELANNATLHGRVPGRDFRLTLTLTLTLTAARTLRIEVRDACRETAPPLSPELPSTDAESGRGLLLVDALADRWGTEAGQPPGKTVWAELTVSPTA
jgi:histidine kinase-like protein